jgi:hypothetical protein
MILPLLLNPVVFFPLQSFPLGAAECFTLPSGHLEGASTCAAPLPDPSLPERRQP